MTKNVWKQRARNKAHRMTSTREVGKNLGFFMQNSNAVQKAFMLFSHVLMSYNEKNKKKITNKILVPLITVNDNVFACQTIPRAHQMTALDSENEKNNQHMQYSKMSSILISDISFVRVQME